MQPASLLEAPIIFTQQTNLSYSQAFSERVSYCLLRAVTSHTARQAVNTKAPAPAQGITGGYSSTFTGCPCSHVLAAVSAIGHPWGTTQG